MRYKKGDNVIVISGNEKGKTGAIERTLPNRKKIIISGINIVKKHVKPSSTGKHSGIIEKPMPIDASNILIICGNCRKNVKVKYMIKQKEKRRICAKCNEAI